ncbi:MAG: nucleotidyltransferase family protein [Candidatus Eremiobacterota bacterium]
MTGRAVVLAGGVNRRPLYPGYRPGCKALVEIAGRSLLSYVLTALAPMKEVGIVGDAALLHDLAPGHRFAPPGEDVLDSLRAALDMYPEEAYILLVTADLPMLRPEMLEQFLSLCAARPGGDVYLALVPEERLRPPFDRILKNLNRFADGAVCHGNLALVRPDILRNEDAMRRVNAVYRERQNPIRSALALGLGLGASYVFGVHLFHRLRLDTFAEMLSRRFAMRMVPVITAYPEVAVDVDEEADYAIACEVLG